MAKTEAPAPMSGLIAGAAGGLVAAFAMTQFQTLVGNVLGNGLGGSGEPSTEKAADRLARAFTGAPLPKHEREVGGEAVHYLFGALIGAVYGLAAEYRPKVTAGHGAAMGVTAASVVDETAVPLTGLGDPPWKAPLTSHPYSYASHLVFGVVCEGVRKLARRFITLVKTGAAAARRHDHRPTPRAQLTPAAESARDRRTLALAFLLGATAGPRTSAPITAMSWAARLGWIDVSKTRVAFLGAPAAVKVTTPMAMSEWVIDKLPATPHRTEPGAVAARAASGAVAGAALAPRSSGVAAAAAGAAGALVGTYVGHAARTRLSKALGVDWPVAVVEDLVSAGGAVAVILASIAPPPKHAA